MEEPFSGLLVPTTLNYKALYSEIAIFYSVLFLFSFTCSCLDVFHFNCCIQWFFFFRCYPGPWKVLRRVGNKFKCLHQQEVMPSLKEVALDILTPA
jgi:hypothetical protein